MQARICVNHIYLASENTVGWCCHVNLVAFIRHVVKVRNNLTDPKDCYNVEVTLTRLWTWALLEKSPIVRLLKNFPEVYRTRRFIAMLTRALHRSLSWARSIQFTPSDPISLRSILILLHCLQIFHFVVNQRAMKLTELFLSYILQDRLRICWKCYLFCQRCVHQFSN
jgi:hypothetical protein